MEKIAIDFNELFVSVQSQVGQIQVSEKCKLEGSKKCLGVIIDAIRLLNKQLSDYIFLNERNEINFFKNLKPKLIALEKYHRQVVEIEINLQLLPTRQWSAFFLKYQDQCHSKKDKVLHKYYLLNSTHNDSNYFLKNNFLSELPFISADENINWGNTTHYCQKFASFIANEMILDYIKHKNDAQDLANIHSRLSLSWHGPQVHFVEFNPNYAIGVNRYFSRLIPNA